MYFRDEEEEAGGGPPRREGTDKETGRPLQDKDPETGWGGEGSRGWGRQKFKIK